jgi:large subunit ribosomal protein L22
MEARAYLKYARISPRKVSIVLDLIRNKPLNYAMAVLKNTPKSACEHLIKLLNSAVANAVNNNRMDITKLFISECFVGPGPILKRTRALSKGRSTRIEKRVSHITLALSEKNAEKKEAS